MNLADDLRRVARNSIRIYFAPLTEAIKGISAELRRVAGTPEGNATAWRCAVDARRIRVETLAARAVAV